MYTLCILSICEGHCMGHLLSVHKRSNTQSVFQYIRNNHAAVSFVSPVYASAGCYKLHALDHRPIDSRFFFLHHFRNCDFAWTCITVHSVGVEETAGTVKPLMKIAFLRHCLIVTTHCVRREIKVKLNRLLFSQTPSPVTS